MTRTVIFMPAARLGAIDEQDWYERQAQGLGSRFSGEIDFQVEHIVTNPLRFPEILADVRRALLRRFPCSLFFRVLPDTVYVIACFHSSRDPLI